MDNNNKNQWQEVLNRSNITGHISDRHLIMLGSKDNYDDNEYGFLDEWFAAQIKLAKEKDKERLLEGVRRRIIYPEPMAEGSDVDDSMMAYNSALEDVEKLIKEIYE